MNWYTFVCRREWHWSERPWRNTSTGKEGCREEKRTYCLCCIHSYFSGNVTFNWLFNSTQQHLCLLINLLIYMCIYCKHFGRGGGWPFYCQSFIHYCSIDVVSGQMKVKVSKQWRISDIEVMVRYCVGYIVCFKPIVSLWDME